MIFTWQYWQYSLPYWVLKSNLFLFNERFSTVVLTKGCVTVEWPGQFCVQFDVDSTNLLLLWWTVWIILFFSGTITIRMESAMDQVYGFMSICGQSNVVLVWYHVYLWAIQIEQCSACMISWKYSVFQQQRQDSFIGSFLSLNSPYSTNVLCKLTHTISVLL